MRSRHMVLLVAFALALGVSATTAGSALAAPEWYSGAPEWQQGGAHITSAAATKTKGKVTLTDESFGKGEAALVVECEVAGEGTAGPGAVDKQTTLNTSKCVVLKAGACTTFEEAKLRNLPWNSELTLLGASLRDLISTGGTGDPGFLIHCFVSAVGAKVVDTCSVKTLSTTTANVTSGVEGSLSSEKLSCTIGGAGTGAVAGTLITEAVSGAKLEAKAVFSKLTSALEVVGKGELKLEDKGRELGAVGVTCKFETTGTIESGGLGKITSFVAISGCTASGGSCDSVRPVGPINIPWKTELFESEGTIKDRIVNGGSGEPNWKFECHQLGVYYPVICGVGVSPEVFNEPIEGNVIASFSEKSKTTCNGDHKNGESWWQGTLTIVHPASKGAIEVLK